MSTSGTETQGNMKQEEKDLLDLYYACVDHDKIDHDLILMLLIAIHTTQPHGAVLVFLPGYEDISIMVPADTVLGRDTNIAILLSQIGSAELKKAFRQQQKGCKKIVLSTNILETEVSHHPRHCLFD